MKMQKIGVKGRRFGFKVGNTFLAVKEYKGKLSFAVPRPARFEKRREKAVRVWMRRVILTKLKTLSLIAILALSIHAQDLVSADGTEWRFMAASKDTDGAKFNVFARRLKGGAYPRLEVRAEENITLQAEHDCKRKLYRLVGSDEWVKPKGSVGAKLIKFACQK